MLHCYLGRTNKEGRHLHCRYIETVEVSPEDEHTIVERSKDSLSCAWCTYHNKPCKDLDYYCSNYDGITNDYLEIK